MVMNDYLSHSEHEWAWPANFSLHTLLPGSRIEAQGSGLCGSTKNKGGQSMVIARTRRAESGRAGGKMAFTLACVVGFVFFAWVGASFAQIPFTLQPKTA